ncbi:putative ABC transporter ATP-binding protein [Legionella geestiana]|uniref:Probable ATP-binding protein YheS n=1 Tax=Legionella geestiana TaxID=45065 RepID=A0A0W0TWR3_9GAMM|nr:ATP-binding cassette domain-containing protein [Legionella geestiana]KTC99884.1 putative ABC transporter ATP-binding protein [Legionella geestiana]QBS13230.1 ATP-binding cassette domain-containing protein [Legionella geestiana]STX54246.1 fused transporter subunits of ABC superfamily: ATP-binding components [Legionella geestiana]
MLTLRNITLTRGTKTLLENASATLHLKQKVGLTGHNGCGKSTLFGMLLGKWSPQAGDFEQPAGLRISHLSQETPDSELSALDFVLAGDSEYQNLLDTLKTAEAQGEDAKVLACHHRLEEIGGYAKPAQAASILAGLGFEPESIHHAVSRFSGGWRMRLALARCLMKPADLLLLDEPTNHLDMEAIFWLERWLQNFPGSIVVISHDREFLDAFVTHILHISQRQTTLYTGNYSRFERTRAEQLALQQTMHEKQQAHIAHLMKFVQRFKAKASKSRQAQSRLKAIAKMELVAGAQVDSPFHFSFEAPPRAGNPLLRTDEVTAGFTRESPILKKVNLQIDEDSRIALLGPNGQGKSTLIKTLTGSLSPLSGTVYHHPNLRIGYFAQHQADDLDSSASPLAIIQALRPDAREQVVRDFLGGFNFIGDAATNPITHFSGGEKARLALAKLVWQKPNLLLLDEPTNHLDLEMRAAMEIALQSFEGALVLISHDRHLLRTAVDTFYLVFNQRVETFPGTLDDYHTWLMQQNLSAKPREAVTAEKDDRRERKSLQNRLKKLEQMLESATAEVLKHETRLSDSELYEAGQEKRLAVELEALEAARRVLQDVEEEWLARMAELEGL